MTHTHVVTCVVRGSSQLLQFQYASPQGALRTYEALRQVAVNDLPGVEIKDDYGCAATISGQDLGVFFLQDLKRQMEGQSEISLLKARAEAAFQRTCQSDPVLNFQGVAGVAPPNARPLRQ